MTDTDIDRGSLAKGIGKATRSFKASGMLVNGSQVLRGFTRLSGQSRADKFDPR